MVLFLYPEREKAVFKRLFLMTMRSFFCMARQMHVIFYFEILLGHESTQ